MFKVIITFTLIAFGQSLKGDYTDNPPPSLIPYLPPESNGNEDPPEVLTAVIAPAASDHESYYGTQPNYNHEEQHQKGPPAPMPYLGPIRSSSDNLPQYRDESPQPLYHAVPQIELPQLVHSSPVPPYEGNEINHDEPPQASQPQESPPQELYVAANSPYDHHDEHPRYHPSPDDDESGKYQHQPYVPSIETVVPTAQHHPNVHSVHNSEPHHPHHPHHLHHPLYPSEPNNNNDNNRESLLDHESHSSHSHEPIHPDHNYSHHPHHEHQLHHHEHHSHHSHKEHTESSSYKSSDHPDAKSSIYHSQDVRVQN